MIEIHLADALFPVARLPELNCFLADCQGLTTTGALAEALGLEHNAALTLMMLLFLRHAAAAYLMVYVEGQLVEQRPFAEGLPSLPYVYAPSQSPVTDKAALGFEFAFELSQSVQFTEKP